MWCCLFPDVLKMEFDNLFDLRHFWLPVVTSLFCKGYGNYAWVAVSYCFLTTTCFEVSLRKAMTNITEGHNI